MNRYFRINWKHDDADFPILMFYEVDSEDCVVRMIEIFPSGERVPDCVGWHDPADLMGFNSLVGSGFMANLPEEFDPELNCEEVVQALFEDEWSKAPRRAEGREAEGR